MGSAPQREEALVLRITKLGDTSKIVTALTARHGLVKAVAKGARTVGSRMGSLLEPGNELELLLYVREGRDLWTLGDATLRRAGLTGASSLDKLSHLLAALELADRVLTLHQPVEEVSDLYALFLDRWHAGSAAQMAGLFFALEAELCARLGVELAWDCCGECGRGFAPGERVLHSVAEAWLRCQGCAGAAVGRWLESDVLATLSGLSAALEPTGSVEITPEQRAAIGRLLHEHMGFHLQGYRLPRALYWTRPLAPDDEESDA